MKVVQLEISGLQGVNHATLNLDQHSVLIGASNVGKSTVVEALSLVLGRNRMHYRSLTEHDFFGSCPAASDRIRIVATLAGFPGNDADGNRNWFSDQAGVEKWWDGSAIHPIPPEDTSELCVQVAYCARFDLVDLVVEAVRYFHDADDEEDPFALPRLRRVARDLVREIGFFFVPAQRTWDRTISFNSELFRRVVRALSELPSEALIGERDRLRVPDRPLEGVESLKALVGRINANLGDLIPGAPSLELRLTETDSDSLLRSLVPHFRVEHRPSLPVRRHGTGLVSLQTLLLLLELGRMRTEAGGSFILAIEEPEIHLPMGAQRQIIHKLCRKTSQLLVTTHSPEIASLLGPETVRVLSNNGGDLVGPPLSPPIQESDSNAMRRLLRDYRAELLEALMHPLVLLPEGRIDHEWLQLILRAALHSERPAGEQDLRFAADVGVVLTCDGAVVDSFARLRFAAPHLVPFVDGDEAGKGYISSLRGMEAPPTKALRWPDGWTVETAVGWICEGNVARALEHVTSLPHVLSSKIEKIIDLVELLQSEDRQLGGLKGNYLAYDDIASAWTTIPECALRCRELLEALHYAAASDDPSQSDHWEADLPSGTDGMSVYVWVP